MTVMKFFLLLRKRAAPSRDEPLVISPVRMDDRPARVAAPGIDPVWPPLYSASGWLCVSAKKYLSPGSYIFWVGFLTNFARWGIVILAFPAIASCQPHITAKGFAVLCLVLWVGCIISLFFMTTDVMRSFIQLFAGRTANVFVGPQRILFEGCKGEAPIDRGTALLVAGRRPHPRATMERDLMQGQRDTKAAAFRVWVWQNSFVVYVEYGDQYAEIAEIYDGVMAARLVSGINAAEKIMQANIAAMRGQRSPWER